MTAHVLDFHPRPEYDELRWAKISEAVDAELAKPSDEPAVLTAQELFKTYYEETLTVCRHLVEFYKRTGRWSPEAEKQMTTVVGDLRGICEILAHNVNATGKQTK